MFELIMEFYCVMAR